MDAPDLSLRPVRPADRARVLEMVADVWEGHDYIPRVFDEWVAEPRASFQAAEMDGVVVGIQRLRPVAPGTVLYEGMRVASTHRRLGLGRAMLAAALEEARGSGYREVRLITGNPAALELFRSAGFRVLGEFVGWSAPRLEGGDPARLPAPDSLPELARRAAADPAFPLYGGATTWWQGPVDIDLRLLEELAGQGLLRVQGGALAGLSPYRDRHLGVNFVFGAGAALRDLLLALRFEADDENLDGAWVAAPAAHPAADDLREVGYDFAIDSAFWTCGLELGS